VWGSWWKDHQWGYKCCKQTIKNSYCTGLAGIEAAEASADLMKANMARKEAAEGIFLERILVYLCAVDNLQHIFDKYFIVSILNQHELFSF
jgi:DNA-binding TFAR19-related protein (PDSD5 family)